jgi:hypothetical protein
MAPIRRRVDRRQMIQKRKLAIPRDDSEVYRRSILVIVIRMADRASWW